MIDRAVSFGLQNFFFVASDESGETYDYVAYVTRRGAILIARYNKAGSEGRYWLGTGTFTTVWAAKGTLTYGLPTAFEDPTI